MRARRVAHVYTVQFVKAMVVQQRLFKVALAIRLMGDAGVWNERRLWYLYCTPTVHIIAIIFYFQCQF